MPQVINTNIASLNAQRNLNQSQMALATSMQRLSSGLRINSAKDDAAGMAIAERFTAQIRGNSQAARNASDGISLSQTAEGDMIQIGNNLQRIRELAVQSANSTNSVSDRAALQQETAQLIAEIDRVAANSSFNGVKLLDGTFIAQAFQVGANATANDRITIASIANARISVLGSATTNATTVAGSGVTANALLAGQLVLNGVSIQGTVAGAAGQTTDSAFAKAAAINAQSALSFVTATAAATSATGIAAAPTVTGATPATIPAGSVAIPVATSTTVVGAAPTNGLATPGDDIAAGHLTINTFAVGLIEAANTSAAQATAVMVAINLITVDTGVTASDAGGVVTLTNATNASIAVAFAGASATTARTGLTAGSQTANTYAEITGTNFTVGGTAVTSALFVGSSTNYATQLAADIDSALSADYVAANVGGKVAISRADGANFSVISTGTSTASVSGYTVGTHTSIDGVPASSTITTIANGDLSINGVAITTAGIAATTSAFQRGTDLAAAINGQQSTTGVTATAAASGALTLSAADGRNIAVVIGGTNTADDTGLSTLTTRSTLTLSSTNSAGITVAGITPGNAGFTPVVQASTATITGGLSLLSISTITGANAALATIDAALDSVNSSRAELGAVQNRFASTVVTLQTTTENLTASRSRIQDTDFAAETAALTRGMIMQQAGVAMLAQANALPNGVMALLR